MHTLSKTAALLGLFVTAAFAAADNTPLELPLILPVDCRPGSDCWVVNYVDLDPTGEVLDALCGHKTYDGHKGTDIAIPDLVHMEQGVPVLAMADGVVRRVRDGEPDGLSSALRERAKQAGRECGNGLVIDHGAGWTSQYCHLRSGSLVPSPGDHVAQGEMLGQVGLSGDTEFPHLHVTLEKDGQVVDPFLGEAGASCGDLSGSLLPDPEFLTATSRAAIYAAGFTDRQPTMTELLLGQHGAAQLHCSAPALIAWMQAYWVESGDRLRVSIRDPEGSEWYSNEAVFEKKQARVLRYYGRRLRNDCWPAGEYRVAFEIFSAGGSEDSEPISRADRVVRLLLPPADQATQTP